MMVDLSLFQTAFGTHHLWSNELSFFRRLMAQDATVLIPVIGLWGTYWLSVFIARVTYNHLSERQLKVVNQSASKFVASILLSGHTVPLFSSAFSIRYTFMLCTLFFTVLFTEICNMKRRRPQVNKLYVATLHAIVGGYCLFMSWACLFEQKRCEKRPIAGYATPQFLTRLSLYFALEFIENFASATDCICYFLHRFLIASSPTRKRLLPWSLPLRDMLFIVTELGTLAYYHVRLCDFSRTGSQIFDLDSALRLGSSLDKLCTTTGRLFTLSYIYLLPSWGSHFETCQICQRKFRAKAIKRLKCGHCFDMACLYLHMRQSTQCPVCHTAIFSRNH